MFSKLLVFLPLLISSAALAVPAAYVHELVGTVHASTKDGVSRQLQVGSTLDQGEIVSTGQGSATLKFEDGQIIALKEKSRLNVVSYKYNKSKVADSNVVLSLLAGSMRFITGVIGGTRHDAIKINVATATLGLRGTDVVVGFDPEGPIFITVQDGRVSFSNQGVTSTVSTGQGSVAASNSPPSNAVPVNQLPGSSVSDAATLTQKSMPANNPVSVQASAKTVKAIQDVIQKSKVAAEAESALAKAVTPADKAAAEAKVLEAKTSLVGAFADAQKFATSQILADKDAKQAALQGGAPVSAGNSPPVQGTEVGVPPKKTETDVNSSVADALVATMIKLDPATAKVITEAAADVIQPVPTPPAQTPTTNTTCGASCN